MITKFALKEMAVANFQNALNEAGMQHSVGKQDKPKYWRGLAKNTSAPLFLVFQVTDNLELVAADDETFRRVVYINGTLYTRNGFSDEDYQTLARSMEEKCAEFRIGLTFSEDGVDTSIDPDSPICYCNFEATQKLLMA